MCAYPPPGCQLRRGQVCCRSSSSLGVNYSRLCEPDVIIHHDSCWIATLLSCIVRQSNIGSCLHADNNVYPSTQALLIACRQ